MNRLRAILGFMVSAFMIASSFAHSLLGWKNLSAELARAHVPPDLISRLGIGWRWGGESMFTFGFIVFFVILPVLFCLRGLSLFSMRGSVLGPSISATTLSSSCSSSPASC